MRVGRGLILWWRCDTLYISGFVDDVMTPCLYMMGPMARRVFLSSECTA